MVTKSNTPITIKMPKELLAQWLADLRSGKYPQGQKAMVDSNGGHCCLAVLVASAGDNPLAAMHDNCLPHPKWLREKGVMFAGAASEGSRFNAGDRSPWLPTLKYSASKANDQKGLSFATIADAIEACAEGT